MFVESVFIIKLSSVNSKYSFISVLRDSTDISSVLSVIFFNTEIGASILTTLAVVGFIEGNWMLISTCSLNGSVVSIVCEFENDVDAALVVFIITVVSNPLHSLSSQIILQ
ncbi:unnamed protein product [Rotaria magnacalcarata]|uniref:Uncharacterized protein n=1 Tax=Rotaria magnacalcarata TaxID=392030 RepID=A0A816YPW1_9BILA|nr:unnamed protein product [Rotaria magnacalcarata]CAF1475070.1 unnamed protein product [Rotaria magnacalcarata]CAF2164794.1 unnamed protein product [Rotaria magnacalcarata]CAF3818713.1 unnamed protein product [Rotaria magnacalcarata]CAF3844011.1 unnamed protein product [Rotaria magnacalcarata]